jgi:hypothetical protein
MAEQDFQASLKETEEEINSAAKQAEDKSLSQTGPV